MKKRQLTIKNQEARSKKKFSFKSLIKFFTIIPIFLIFFSLISYRFLIPAYAATGINKTINFQGRIVNKTDGTNIPNGSYDFTFKLFDAASSGTLLWTETRTAANQVTVTNGFFSVALGSVQPLTAFDFNQDNLWLDVTFTSETFGSRVRLTAAPYAFNADKVGGITGTSNADGFQLAGGTTSRTLTVTGANITVGSTITPTSAGGLTIQSNGANGLTLTGGALSTFNTTAGNLKFQPAGTGTTGSVQIGEANGLGGSATPDLLVLDQASGSLPTGVKGGLIVDSTNKLNFYDGSAWKQICNLTDLGCGAGGGGARLDQITAANTTATIDSLNNPIVWGWSTLTTQTGLTLTGGTAMTTGSVLGITGVTYKHTANESDAALDIAFTDATNTTNTSTTDGLKILPTLNLGVSATSGTKTVNGLEVVAPTLTACTSGSSCTVNDAMLNTATTGFGSNITQNALTIAATGVSSGTLNGINISGITPAGGNETALTIGAGWDTGITIAASGTGQGILVNTTGTGGLLSLQNNSVNKFSVGNNGGVVVNGSDSSIVRQTASDFALGTIGSSLTNADNSLSLSDTVSGGIPNSGNGTITTTSQPTTSAAIGAGAFSITRADGKYLVIRGGGTGIDIYDSVAGTFTNSSLVLNNAAGVGALALPRPGGWYRIIHGGGALTTSLVDPMGVNPVGISVAVTSKGAGTVADLRPDGRYIITNAPTLATTQLYDPIADTFVTGPSGTGGNWGVGAVVLHRTDGQALFVVGGASSNTQLYDPSAGAITGVSPIGAFTAGPSLDGKQAAGTCALNGNGSVAFRRQDGKFVILSKVNVWAVYDPTANDITCNTSGGPATAIGDGGQAIPLQNGKFLVLVGGGSTNSYLYDPSNDSFTSQGTALTAVTTGAHAIMRANGTWQILVGGGTATNNYNTGFPMSDSTTAYTSEDIFSSNINTNSTFWWRAQTEAVYAGTNGSSNTAFSSMQFLVRSAQSSNGLQSGCTTPLNSATDIEIRNSGDLIQAVGSANCVRVKVQYNRPLPKRLFDERGVWVGNGMTSTRFDIVSPRLYNYKIDNSAVLKRANFDFTFPNASAQLNPAVPAALTAAESATGGSCTAGTHAYYSAFITNGVESALSTKSNVITCAGGTDKVNLTAIPLGPNGTTARKIYRTAAGDTGTPLLVTTISDNTTTTLTSDTAADTSLGAAYASVENSGPVMTRSETRVEAVNGNLVLPYGRLTATTQVGTTGYYMGEFTNAHPLLNNVAGLGTMVIARDDKTFLIIEGGGQTADLYDPATETFTNQSSTGDKPTGAVGAGAFALKRPDGNFLVYLGTGATTTTCTTSGTATNIYDPYQASGSHFTNGPCLSAGGGIGAQAILNTDGTYTILHGNATTNTSIYNPITNTMIVGPVTTTAINCGSWAIPMALPNNNQYKVKAGVAAAGTALATGTMNYDANSKVFSAAPNLSSITGCGSFAFQRQDGYWVILEGETAGALGSATNIMNPFNGTTVAGPALTNGTGRGAHVIPRADGTYLIVGANSVVGGAQVATTIYFPTGGAATNNLGVPGGTVAAGPSMILGGGASPALPTAGTPTAGGLCTSGTHSYKYTDIINGVESQLSAVSATVTCDGGAAAGTVPLSVIAAGPTGTTARKVYRTAAGAAATGPWKLLTTINDNTTTIFSDTLADGSLGANGPVITGPNEGSLSFQRPDGKFVTIFGGTTATAWTNLYDAGWYSDGQYLSEEMNVPALAANSTLEWQKTSDAYVRFEARTAASQAALGAASFKGIDAPGGSMNNAGGETWVQVELNFRRDFPTYCWNMNGVYNSGAGEEYCNRTISLPTVMQYQITNGQDLLSLQTNGYNMLRVTSNGGIYSSQQGGFFAGGADLAERYTSQKPLIAGEVVSVDPTNNQGVIQSYAPYQHDLLGVVSTDPGIVTGAYTADAYPIALIGRVPVQVTSENGSIQAGDYLTSATTPGFAMKAIKGGRVLGKALEAWTPDKNIVCPGTTSSTVTCGSILMFVNLTDYSGQSIDLVMADQTNSGALLASSTVDGITQDNTQTVIASQVIPQQDNTVLAFLEEQKQDAYTSSIYTDKIAATDEVISPKIVADELFVKTLHADRIEGLEILTNKISALDTQIHQLENPIATTSAEQQDPFATQSAILGIQTSTSHGVLSLASLSVDGLATVSADFRVKGNSLIEGVLSIIDTIKANNIIATGISDFFGQVIFHGDVLFKQTPTFPSDTAGVVTISKDSQSVTVQFTKEYTTTPVITTTLSTTAQDDLGQSIIGRGYTYIITKKSPTGFTILLNKKAEEDLTFSWIALAVEKSTVSSQASQSILNQLIPTPTDIPIAMQSGKENEISQ